MNSDGSQQDDPLVSVFSTDDSARLPLAELALKGEGIPYLVKDGPRGTDTMGWTLTLAPSSRPRVIELLVAPDVAARARELLADLEEAASSNAQTADAVFDAAASASTAIQLEDASTGILVGTITENELQELTSHLDEDSPQQYFVDSDTIGALEHARVDAELVDLLRHALGDADGIVVRWTVR